jgi:hypothetical protein
MTLRLFLVFALVMQSSLSFSMTAPTEDLTQTERARLTNKELVVRSEEVPRCPWPEITVFTLIDVLPVEAAALFSNYQDQKEYVPNLIKSNPVGKTAENETIVDFEMHVPWPLTNYKYSTCNVFNKLENNEYEISWYLVESNSLVASKGIVQFIPYGKKTLLKYRSLIHPDSRLASMFSSKARSGIANTVQAIATYIESTKKKNPEKIQKLIGSLPKQILPADTGKGS